MEIDGSRIDNPVEKKPDPRELKSFRNPTSIMLMNALKINPELVIMVVFKREAECRLMLIDDKLCIEPSPHHRIWLEGELLDDVRISDAEISKAQGVVDSDYLKYVREETRRGTGFEFDDFPVRESDPSAEDKAVLKLFTQTIWELDTKIRINRRSIEISCVAVNNHFGEGWGAKMFRGISLDLKAARGYNPVQISVSDKKTLDTIVDSVISEINRRGNCFDKRRFKGVPILTVVTDGSDVYLEIMFRD